MNNRNPILHTYTSRNNTLRMRLSEIGWAYGSGNFFTQNVPISYSTSRDLASKLLAILHKQFATLPTNIHICEIGAGTGLLSKHILDCCLDRYPDTYQGLQLCVSDVSESILADIRRLGILETHGLLADGSQEGVFERATPFRSLKDSTLRVNPSGIQGVESPQIPLIKLLCINILNTAMDENELKPKPYHMIYMCNVIDSLPVRHIEIRDGEIFEIQIQTRLSQDTPIYDTSTWPPTPLSTENILAILNDTNTKKAMAIAPTLIQSIRETERHIPLKESDLSDADKADIVQFVESMAMTDCRFNYPCGAREALREVSTQLATNALLFISDGGHFSTTQQIPTKSLLTSYGTATYALVFFPYIHYCLHALGLETVTTQNPEGDSQSLFASQQLSDDIKQDISVNFSAGLSRFEAEFEKIVMAADEEETQDRVSDLVLQLSPLEQQDYNFLLQLTKLAFHKEFYTLAQIYVQKAIESYGPMAAEAMFLQGQLHQAMGNIRGATQCFEYILSMFPYYVPVYGKLGTCYAQLGDFEKAIQALTFFIQHAPQSEMWEKLLTLSLIYLQMGQKEKGRVGLEWIRDIAEKNPQHVPTPCITKVRFFLSQT